MNGWCPLCGQCVDAQWSTSAEPVAFHLLGASMHSVQVAEEPPGPVRETVIRQRGEYVTVGGDERMADEKRFEVEYVTLVGTPTGLRLDTVLRMADGQVMVIPGGSMADAEVYPDLDAVRAAFTSTATARDLLTDPTGDDE